MIRMSCLAFALALTLPPTAMAVRDASAPAPMQTVVTSESLTFDYQRFQASFLHNVRVVDPEFL